MENFSPETTSAIAPRGKSYSLWAIITLILLPPMCFLSIPAVIFAAESKSLYKSGSYDLSIRFAKKAKRYTVSAWVISAILALTVFALYFISRLSLI